MFLCVLPLVQGPWIKGIGNRNQLSDLDEHKDSNCYLLHLRQQHKGSSKETDLPRPRASSNTEASSFAEMQLYPVGNSWAWCCPITRTQLYLPSHRTTALDPRPTVRGWTGGQVRV